MEHALTLQGSAVIGQVWDPLGLLWDGTGSFKFGGATLYRFSYRLEPGAAALSGLCGHFFPLSMYT